MLQQSIAVFCGFQLQAEELMTTAGLELKL
jgi:hypothetical protein